MDQGAEADGGEFRAQGNDGGELGSASCQPAGLKAWPSLRVRCSGYQLKRTRDRLISSNLISDFRRVTTNRSQLTDFRRRRGLKSQLRIKNSIRFGTHCAKMRVSKISAKILTNERILLPARFRPPRQTEAYMKTVVLLSAAVMWCIPFLVKAES